MLKPGSLISRTAALAILVLVLFAAYRLIAAPLIERYSATEQRIANAIDLLQRYRTLAAERPALTDRLAAMKEQGEAVTGYWKGTSYAQMTAELQDHAAEIVDAYDGAIRSIQPLDATDVDESPGLSRIGLKLRFSAGIEGLASIMHDIETADPYMFIEQLGISQERGEFLPDGTTNDDIEPQLDVRLGLSGFVHDLP